MIQYSQKLLSINRNTLFHSSIVYNLSQMQSFFQLDQSSYSENRSQGSLSQQLRLQIQSDLDSNSLRKMDIQQRQKLVIEKPPSIMQIGFIKSTLLDQEQQIIFNHLQKFIKQIKSCFDRDFRQSYIPIQNRDLYSFKLYINPLCVDEVLQIYGLLKDSNLLKVSSSTFQEKQKANFSYSFDNLDELRRFVSTFEIKKNGIKEQFKQKKYELIIQSQNVAGYLQENYPFPRTFCIKKINNKFRQQHFLSLKTQWDAGLAEFLGFIEQHWQQYSNIYEKEIQRFVMINLYKIYKLSLNSSGTNQRARFQKITCFYEIVYPNIIYLIESFCNKLNIQQAYKLLYQQLRKTEQMENHQKYKNRNVFKNNENQSLTQRKMLLQSLQKTLNLKENIVDQIFLYYIEDQKGKANILTKITLDILTYQAPKMRQQIKNINDFCMGLSQISDLLSSIFYRFNRSINQINFEVKCPIILEECEDVRLFKSCLCCSQFFYTNVNIYDDSITKMPVYLFPSITRLKQIEVQLKDRICTYLNTGGGVILFNCVKIDRFIYAKGDRTSQKNKEQYEQRIHSYIKQFYPKLELNKHITISFIPLLEIQKSSLKQKYIGRESQLKRQILHFQQRCLKAVYVTRINVSPIDPYVLYFWSFPSNYLGFKEDTYYCYVKSNEKQKAVEMKNVVRSIKNKMKYYIPDNISIQQRQLLSFPSSYFDHQIITPDAGQFLSGKFQEDKKVNKYIDPQLEYKEMSLIVIDLKHIQNINKILNERFQCLIHAVFSKLGYKLAKKSAIIYHNIKFQQLLDQLYNNKKLLFVQKKIIAIHITTYLKFVENNKNNPYQEKDLLQIVQLFTSKCKSQNVKIYKYITENGDYEYYCQTQTKISSVLLYYMMNQYRKRLMFKNPASLDKFSPQQKQKSFILLFQSRLVEPQKQSFEIQAGIKNDYSNGFVPFNSEKNNKLNETSNIEIII